MEPDCKTARIAGVPLGTEHAASRRTEAHRLQPIGSVTQGQVWIIDPLELHWLRPDTLASSPWIALQWVVDTDKVERFMVAFRAQLKAWNQPDFVLPTLE